ncbi:SUKH-4 family immunity protein [Nonomuraea longicatena]|uniref:SUKH-4 family immunity protein n=1 Tax=Nonomuraea longicatena TaxID=83682 RepID=UPI003CD09015
METEGFPRGNGLWPSKRRVVFGDPGCIAGSAAAMLVEQGVPCSLIGLMYTADAALEIVDHPTCGKLVRFGHSGYSELICVNIEDGHVLQFSESIGDRQVSLVNSSLGQFVQSADLVVDRFPFYSI